MNKKQNGKTKAVQGYVKDSKAPSEICDRNL